MTRLREVSEEEFFAKIGPMNVHPRSEEHATYWETPRRELIGVSHPGYKAVGEKKYFFPTHEMEGQS
jgi:hypothetical protein